MMTAPTPTSSRLPLRAFVALTPLLGSIAFPIAVPLLMVRSSIAAGVLGAVVIGTLWFVAMLRTAEMPGHH